MSCCYDEKSEIAHLNSVQYTVDLYFNAFAKAGFKKRPLGDPVKDLSFIIGYLEVLIEKHKPELKVEVENIILRHAQFASHPAANRSKLMLRAIGDLENLYLGKI